MKISYTWLNDRFFAGGLPAPEKVAGLLTMNSFEVESVEKVGNETIFDIKILPNRSHDCLSHKGIAREISTLLSKDLSYSPEKTNPQNSVLTTDAVSLSIEEGARCNRATKRLVRDVTVEKSPDWLIQYLQAVGQKPINNIVDSANFVMLETGQPVHTFDFDKIAGEKKNIKIRNAKAGEEIQCLDNKTYTLDENVIVISDDKGALDIAGIKGGLTSGIDENTKTVVLSACNFDSISIRKTSKKLGLRTDASARFENGITPELVDEAMELLSALVEKTAGGKVAADIVDIYPRRENKYVVGVSVEEINKLLGTRMNAGRVSSNLDRAKFEYTFADPVKEVVKLAPTFLGVPYKWGSSRRFDAPRSFDCSSFVSYLYAIAGVSIPRVSVDQYMLGTPIDIKKIQPGDLLFFSTKTSTTHYKTVDFVPGTEVKEGVDHVALYMGKGSMIHATARDGINKVIEESFEKSPIRNLFVGVRRFVNKKEKRFAVKVPYERLDIRIKEDLIEEIQRLSGYENIKTIKHVPAKKTPTVDKNIYYQNKIRNILISLGFSEIYTYAFTDKGEVELQNPIASNKNFLRKTIATAMEESMMSNLQNLDLFGLEQIKTFEIGKVFERGGERATLVLGIKNRSNKNKGVAKELEEAENKLKTEFGVSFESNKPAENIIEIDFSKLIQSLPVPTKFESLEIESVNYQYKKISLYPFIVRDVAVFVPTKITAEVILGKILKMTGPMLVKNKLFDVFTKKFPDGNEKTSYAFRLVFQSDERTLTDEEVNKIMIGVVETLAAEKDWQVR